MAELSDFLTRSAREPFVWGLRDCAFWTAAWLSECAGFQVAAKYIGKYHDRRGCAELVAARGGLRRLAEEIADEVGARAVTDDLRPGDVSLMPLGPFGVMAIYVGPRFAAKAPLGVTLFRGRPVKTWRLAV